MLTCPHAKQNWILRDMGKHGAIYTYLCETEEEANATNKSQNLSRISSYYWSTGWARMDIFKTALYELKNRFVILKYIYKEHIKQHKCQTRTREYYIQFGAFFF